MFAVEHIALYTAFHILVLAHLINNAKSFIYIIYKCSVLTSTFNSIVVKKVDPKNTHVLGYG